ncbi:MAG: heparinase II/III family protein [Salinispira sp.]
MNIFNTLKKYFFTIRCLRPVQIFNRILRRLPKIRPVIREVPVLNLVRGTWIAPVAGAPCLTGPNEFVFMGERGSITEIGWNGPEREALWRYNLHYFDSLTARGAQEQEDWHKNLIEDWVRQNPPCGGAGWEPYPLSRRIVNIIKWSLAGNELTAVWKQSIFLQAAWLRRNIEWHLLANHLLANAKALIFAGLFFTGRKPRRWLSLGLAILKSELDEQILADGGHFERSPMYHAIVLEDILDIINVLGAYYGADADVTAAARAAIAMLGWAEVMTHPDTHIAFFNDSALGIAPTLSQLSDYAERLHVASTAHPLAAPKDEPQRNVEPQCARLPQSGYIKIATGPATAILDVAPIGPNYQPGHAHADTLSFELSLWGMRVLVNGGTSCYGLSARRLAERQTSAHNTVEINGESSSEVWSGFRVGRRARPVGLRVLRNGKKLMVRCSHTGYRRIGGEHVRTWCMEPQSLTIEDMVTGEHPAVARFRFHPRCVVKTAGKNMLVVNVRGAARAARLIIHRGSWRLASGAYAPQFGAVLPAPVLEVSCAVREPALPGQQVLRESLVHIHWADEIPEEERR